MVITLPDKELLRIDGNRRRLLLHCLAGTIWVTDGSGRDCLLGAGRTFTTAGSATIVVEALGGAEVRVAETEMTAKETAALRLAVS